MLLKSILKALINLTMIFFKLDVWAYGRLVCILMTIKNIKFSTFAVPCIRNEICMYLRGENKHKNLVSFDALNEIAVEDVDIDMSILNAIGVNEKDYAFLLAQGLTNSECERCLSISRQALSIKRRKIKKNLEEVLKKELA